MKISTATSVFVNYPLQEAVEQVIAAGFDGIDLWCGRPHVFRGDHSPQALQELRRRLEAASLTPVSLMPAFFRYPFSLSSPNEIVRQDSTDYVKDCIENAVRLGAGTVLIVPTHSLYGQGVEDARGRFMESLGQLCKHAEQNKVMLGIEILYPQLSDYLCSSEDALGVVGALGSDRLGVVIDTGHLNLSGEAVESVLEKLGGLLLQVHVNDNDGKQQQNAIPGEGTFDFDRLVELLRRQGYEGFLSLELGWHYSFDPFPAAQRALGRVRAIL